MIQRLLILSLLLFTCCVRNKESIPELPEVNAPHNRTVIYQIMVRLFGNKQTVNKRFGTLAENGCGKMADINDAALQGIKELGATHVWYTGIIEHASCTAYPEYGIQGDDPDVVKGVAGSPYSVRDYYDVHPDLAINIPNRMKEFEELVERTHRHGLKVIIDFVPNHVARSYRSDAKPRTVRDFGEDDNRNLAFAPANNFYYLPGKRFKPPRTEFIIPGMDGEFDEYPAKATANDVFSPNPSVNDWFEAVKLNYGIDMNGGEASFFDPVPDTWIKMRDILMYWTDKGVDGFRCDVAWMVPVQFWNWVIPQVKSRNPDMLFIAEIYQPELYRDFLNIARFDLLYDKVQLYDTLRLLMEGKSEGQAIASIQNELRDISSRLLHFMENHDEQRIASEHFAGNPWKGIPAMVISSTLDNGAILIYFGQEVGEPATGDPGFQTFEKKGVTTKMDYWAVPEHQKWMNGGAFDGGGLSEDQKQLRQTYGRLLKLSATSPALLYGEFADLTKFNFAKKNISNRIVAYLRYNQSEKLLIIAGFNDRTENAVVEFPVHLLSELKTESETVRLKDMMSETEMEITDALGIAIRPFGYYLFKVQ
ncbi:MAG: alpha-amylase family protein [Cyclobacteriaceae bacterium]|nr:alpha-amylase family protein [Cyclobacteriaceae bacterium]MDW8331509.1 alpha-amylase family protein [Cyclobacteriaceae bacterium]